MVEKRYYCEKHPNVALNMGYCATCMGDILLKFGGCTFVPYYNSKMVRVGVTQDYSSIANYYIEHHHQVKTYWIEDDSFYVPVKVEGEFLRMKHYAIQNDYTHDELCNELNRVINKFKKTCTCYTCETSRVPA